MPDSPDQMIYTLQQENKSLKKILKEKEKKLQQKGREYFAMPFQPQKACQSCWA